MPEPPQTQSGPVGDPQPYVGNGQVALDVASARRTEQAVRWVEGTYRYRTRDGRHRNTPMNAGVWAHLSAGAVVGGASGLTLGQGTAQICSRTGATCVADGAVVTFYNAGNGFTAPAGGMLIKLGWTDGDWSVDVAACS